jgi:hypothetical protein
MCGVGILAKKTAPLKKTYTHNPLLPYRYKRDKADGNEYEAKAAHFEHQGQQKPCLAF